MSFARLTNVFLGLWLFFAPWLLGYQGFAAKANDHWIGLLVIVVAVVASRHTYFRFGNTVLGLWMVLAPFLFGYGETAAIGNDLILGVGVTLFSMIGRDWRPSDEAYQRAIPVSRRSGTVAA